MGGRGLRFQIDLTTKINLRVFRTMTIVTVSGAIIKSLGNFGVGNKLPTQLPERIPITNLLCMSSFLFLFIPNLFNVFLLIF